MCGRTACTLDPDDLRCACAYTNRRGQRRRPHWRQPPPSRSGGGSNHGSSRRGREHHGRNNHGSNSSVGSNGKQGTVKEYFPSTNISPQSVTPVLVSSKHFNQDVESDEQSLTPMQWGLVPSWHKGDASQVAYKMNNCRSEGMMAKSMYKRPFEKGRRCVVLADGYYEWKTAKGSKTKQPFFIYMSQTDGGRLSQLDIRSTGIGTCSAKECDEEVDKQCELHLEGGTQEGDEVFKEWTGHRLLAMAGIFDCWISPNDGKALYTYTIITTEATSSMADIHHRMPVVLNGDDAIRDWLDFDTVSAEEALKLVMSLKCLQFHPVSSQVNNSRYKGLDCVKPIEIGKPPESKSSNLMKSWLKKDTPTKKDPDSATNKDSITLTKNEIKQVQLPIKRKKSMMEQWLEKGTSPQKKAVYD